MSSTPGQCVIAGMMVVRIEQIGLAIAKGWRAVPAPADFKAHGCGLVQRDHWQ